MRNLFNLSKYHYINKKDIQNIKDKYFKHKHIFTKLIDKFIDKKIEKHNKNFINKEIKKAYLLNNINGYSLDLEQKTAVITDEDSCLIVAGAGSGKTLTMIGKIRYLIEYKNVKPKDILCISFTNFTTESLKKNIRKQCDYDIDVLTFHKLSLNIIKKNNIQFKICTDNILSNIVKTFFQKDLLLDRFLLHDFINNYCLCSTIKFNESNLNIEEEIIISNYLYFNNINYEYKKIGIYDNKFIFAFYLPDYNLYIKYFNIDNNDNNLDVTNYLNEIEIIRKYFNLKTLELFPNHFEENTVFDELNTFFIDNKIKIKKKNLNDIYNIFLAHNNNYLYNLITSFVNSFKANNYTYQKFDEIEKTISKSNGKKRLLVILKIIKSIYTNYQIYLKQNNLIDFNDMINEATNLINQNKVILNYKYIIIDEYQDTSFSRYSLIKTIKEKTNSKLIAVGDDFQSIYRFTGCNINMFLNFKNHFNYSKILYLTNTYRNSKELIKVAGDFIMKNKYQIKKTLNSKKSLYKPIKIYFYKKKEEITLLFKQIKENNIFVLGRNNNDINYFDNNDFSINDNKITYLNNKNMNITFMSVHKSKGLENDAVVMVNLENNILGFPSKIKENILLKYLNNMDEAYPFDEERRLFYVALTRTKGNAYLFVPYKNKSIFVDEIIKDNKNLIEFIN